MELPDLRRAGVVSLDTETRDGGLAENKGSGWPWGDGHVCGVSVGWHEGNNTKAAYLPVRHPDTECLDRERVAAWLRDLLASDVRVVTQNGLYDFGWLWGDLKVEMPLPDRLEEIGAMATIIDENRYTYNLDDLCVWRGLPGKDDAALRLAVARVAPETRRRKDVDPRKYLYLLPARDVAAYAEADAVATLHLWQSLDPVLNAEGTRDAYRLEVDLLPMVHAMRRRGIRVDEVEANFAYDDVVLRRDEVFDDLSERLGQRVGMEEIGRTKWLAQTFDAQGIRYPRTAKGNPSFTAGTTGWMPKHPHWLPQLIVKADKYDCAAEKFLKNYILGHVKNGRVYSEVHPHRSDDGGTRSLRFAYSNPPLQQMTAHDPELAPLIRGVFLPEEGEVWAKPDVSQQEYRFIVHYAETHGLRRASEAADRYRKDPKMDFHRLDGARAPAGEEHQLRQVVRRGRPKVRRHDREERGRGARDLRQVRPRAAVRQRAQCALPARSAGQRVHGALRRRAQALGHVGAGGLPLRSGVGAAAARGGQAPRRRPAQPMVPDAAAARRHAQGDERFDPGLRGAPHQASDASDPPRGRGPDAPDARLRRLLGEDGGGGQDGRAHHGGGRRADRARRGRPSLRIILGRRQPRVGGAMTRTCGACQLCCKLLPVRELSKGAGERCRHQRFGKGCLVYHKPGFPMSCAMWSCRWLVNDDTAELSRPDRSHYVVDMVPDRIKITPPDGGDPVVLLVVQVWVDPAFPDAHRDPALRRYLERRAEQDDMAALVRYSSTRGMTLFAPIFDAQKRGEWAERESNVGPGFKSLVEEAEASL